MSVKTGIMDSFSNADTFRDFASKQGFYVFPYVRDSQVPLQCEFSSFLRHVGKIEDFPILISFSRTFSPE